MAASSSEHSDGRIDSSSLLSWGSNSYGQLGQGHQEDQLTASEICLRGLTTVPHSVAGGGGHTLVITGDGSLWVCGSNSHGQLGLGHKEDKQVLTQVTFPTPVKVRQVSGGWDFTLACTADGEVYSWGSNAFEQLGRDAPEKYSTLPGKVEIPSASPVVCVAAGLRHSLAVTEDGCVFGWGQNKNGQVGNITDAQGQQLKSVQHPSKVPLAEKAVHVVAGAYFSAALTESGSVCIWGCNKFGQLAMKPGTDLTQHSLNPSLFDGKQIRRIVAGWTHCVAVTGTGEVYTWGRGDYSQLGRSCDGSCDFTPKLVPDLRRVTSAACGSEHTLCLTDEGKVFCWGWNEHGMCGTGDESNVPSPVSLSLPGKEATSVGCGAGHSFALVRR